MERSGAPVHGPRPGRSRFGCFHVIRLRSTFPLLNAVEPLSSSSSVPAHRTTTELSKRRPCSVVSRVTMLSRTEPFPIADVVTHRRPSRISQQLAVQGRISLSEVLSALSCALDLTEGAPAGHSMRACLIGMRIAEAIGLDASERSALYYALLLKDAGCSSNAGRMAALFGADDQMVKPRMKAVDWHRRVGLALETARTVAHGRPLVERVRQFVAIARTPDTTRNLIQIRCDRGASIALQLGFPAETADAIRSLDEHWCGRGYARGLSGAEIPLLARIANLAQTIEAFHDRGGVDAAHRVARERSGRWFDPVLARIVIRWRRDDPWWDLLRGD